MNREEQALKKSFYALLFSLVLALVTLVGCGGSSAAAGSSGKVTLESAAEQLESESGNTQESSGPDSQPSDLLSRPDQVDGATNGETAKADGATNGETAKADGATNGETAKADGAANGENAKTDGAANSEAVSSSNGAAGGNRPSSQNEPEATIDENGIYTSKEDVALYIHVYGNLPKNFMTKKEAKKLGWEGGSLERYAKGKCIGGDHFGNYEGILPSGNYYECDIDTLGRKSRGAKRIIYSDDGRIYYTEDHYETFELLYEA